MSTHNSKPRTQNQILAKSLYNHFYLFAIMKKSVSLIKVPIVILLILFLSACTGQVPAGEQQLDTAAALKLVQTGTQGVEVKTLPNQPPALLYDQNELVAMVEVHNRGNYDLDPTQCFTQITGFDTNIISGSFGMPQSCAVNVGMLEGKNVYNVEGSTNLLEFRAPNIILPLGVFEYNPNLNIVTCYDYHTIANPQVCVDPLFYQVTAEQKSCIPQDVGMGGGQGAPVGISYVGVDMVGNKAVFEINVINQGGGRVLAPGSNIQNCGSLGLDYRDFDKVHYEVSLSGGSPISCSPVDHMVRLTNNQGKIVCSFSINSPSAFETPLFIDLDYSYIKSQQQLIKIVRTPGT